MPRWSAKWPYVLTAWQRASPPSSSPTAQWCGCHPGPPKRDVCHPLQWEDQKLMQPAIQTESASLLVSHNKMRPEEIWQAGSLAGDLLTERYKFQRCLCPGANKSKQDKQLDLDAVRRPNGFRVILVSRLKWLSY